MAYPATVDLLTDPNGATTLGANGHAALHAAANAVIEALENKLGTDTGTLALGATQKISFGGVLIQAGAGTPEAAITAPVGSIYLRTNGSAAATLYIKESGAGNTGWVGAGAGGVSASLFDANTVLYATANDTPVALTVAVDTVVGRITGGTIGSLYPYGFPVAIDAQVGTTYTAVLADSGKVITASNAAAIALTIPANATTAFPIGTILTIEQKGAGQVTITAAGGVTINSAMSLKTRAQYSVVQLRKDLTDTWTICGDLEPLGQVVNAQVGTTYTPVIGDAYKYITLSNGAAITFTVPSNASVAFPVGTRIDLRAIGAGQVTVAPAGGVTVNATPGLKLRAQHSGASLFQYLANTWALDGDLSA